MSDLNTIIDAFNNRYNIYKQRLSEAKEIDDSVTVIALEASLSELSWCITEVQSAHAKTIQRWDSVTLGDKCHFKKHKGKLWKEVIENDPNYADWCLGNIAGFQFDQTAHNFLVEMQGRYGESFANNYDDFKR